MALKISYNLYGKNLFIYEWNVNGRGFHGLYLVREQFQSDMYLVRKSKSISSTFLLCLQKDDNLEL